MNKPSTQSRGASAPQSPVAWRIRFVGEAPAGSRVLHQFRDPFKAIALAEKVSLTEITTASNSAPGGVDVIAVADETSEIAPNWLAPTANDASHPVSLKFNDGRISWRCGRAIIEGDAAFTDQALVILAEFSFYESQLCKLESALPAYETGAAADVALSYRPSDQHQPQWDRLGKTMENLAELRLAYARLEPKLLYRSLAHDTAERRIFARLCRAADTEDRLEAVTNRMEACEDLYEGAIDRINDHRWYRKGHRLELAIVVLLIIEVLQIAAQLAIQFFHQ